MDGTTYPGMGDGVYVQNKCGYTAAITGASALYGASVKSYSISGGGYSGTAATLNSGLLKSSGTVTVTFRVTDSRGLYTQKTVNLTVLAYSAPKASSLKGWRVSDSGGTDVTGTLGRCLAVWSYTTLGGANSCSAAAYLSEEGGEESALGCAMASGEACDITDADGSRVTLDLTKIYTLRLALTDAYGTVSATAEIPSGNFAIHLAADGTSIAFGGACRQANAVEVIDRTLYLSNKPFVTYIPAYNLLDNSNFRKPVNQRGVSGTVSTAGYFLDRWKLTSGSVTVNSGSITLNGTMVQILETAAGTATAACDGGAAASYDDSSKTFTLTGDGATVTWAALYAGTFPAETLEPYVPKGYGAELAECRRYYRRVCDAVGRKYGSATVTRLSFTFDEMRAVPTITPGTVRLYAPDSTDTVAVTSVRANYLEKTGGSFDVNHAANGAASSTLPVVAIGWWALSAEP